MQLKHWRTGEAVEINNGKELKDFLKYLNPTLFKKYKNIIEKERQDIEVIGFGNETKIIKKKL